MSSYSMPALHFDLVSRTLLLANNYGRPITIIKLSESINASVKVDQ